MADWMLLTNKLLSACTAAVLYYTIGLAHTARIHPMCRAQLSTQQQQYTTANHTTTVACNISSSSDSSCPVSFHSLSNSFFSSVRVVCLRVRWLIGSCPSPLRCFGSASCLPYPIDRSTRHVVPAARRGRSRRGRHTSAARSARHHSAAGRRGCLPGRVPAAAADHWRGGRTGGRPAGQRAVRGGGGEGRAEGQEEAEEGGRGEEEGRGEGGGGGGQREREASKAKAATARSADEDEDDEDDEDGEGANGAEEKKALTKTALKKAKKEAAKRKEEERLKAEAEAKKKAEEAEKKKAKKKKAKKTEGEAAASSTAEPSPSASQQSSKREDEGWEVQKSDKPSSNKPASMKGQAASNAPASASAAAANSAAARSASKKADGEGGAAAAGGPQSYEEMYIPFKFHAQLIGAKGATLQQLQQGTGAKIDMPKKDSGSTKVQITGSSEGVQAAKGAIDSLISKGYSTITHPGYVHDDLSVPDDKMGHIIGPSGAYIKAIQDKTKTRINLPDKDSGSSRVTIVGKKEDVRSARLAIKELLTDGYSPLTHENFVKREVPYPADKLHVLIGSKGQTIKSIQGNSKARIRIPERSAAQGQSEVLIAVVGTAEQVAQAEREIKRLLIPVTVVEEEPEEEYVNGTWSEAGPTEDELWE